MTISFCLKSVEHADEFQEIREIIDRYETLTTNLKDLLEIEKENEEKMNKKRKDLNAYSEVCITALK
jgi:hypothetical protein